MVAVVLAPGARLSTQDRSFTGASCSNSSDPCNTTANYLEGLNSDTSSYNDYETRIENLTDAVAANLFNDQLLAITEPNLMSVVEPAVAAYIANDVVGQYIYNSDSSLTDSSKQWSDNAAKRNMSRYFDAWGGFPFAAPFANPGSSSFTGQSDTYEGLLPVVSNLTYTWSSPSVTQTGGSGTVWSGSSCSTASSNTKLQCNIWYQSGVPTIRISGTVSNIGRSFVQLTRLSDVTCSGCTLSARTLSGSLTNTGAGIVNLDATLNSVGGWTNVTVTITNNNLITSPLISPSDSIAGWLTSNNWHMLTYYAVSTGFAPAERVRAPPALLASRSTISSPRPATTSSQF